MDELGRLVGAGLGVDEFRAASLRSLRRTVTIDAAFYATVDGATMMMTSALSEPPLVDVASRFLDNEYGVVDVNKFSEVADLAAVSHRLTGSPVVTVRPVPATAT